MYRWSPGQYIIVSIHVAPAIALRLACLNPYILV